MQLGIIRPSYSNWASPLHLLSNCNGAWCAYGDYHVLHAITRTVRYPISCIHDVTTIIQHKSIFSKLDLIRASNQLPVEPADILKTAITTSFGLFKFVSLPFGLRKPFQRFIDHVLHGLDFVCTYIDDVLVASCSMEEHINHSKIIFKRLKKYGIIINSIYCAFDKTGVEFLVTVCSWYFSFPY